MITMPRSASLGIDQNRPGSPTDSIAALPEATPEIVSVAAISKAAVLLSFIVTQNSPESLFVIKMI